MIERKVPNWLRALEVIMGLIAIILSIVVLAYPMLAILTLIFILSIVLLVVGISGIATGISAKYLSNGLRAISTGAGLLAIILSIVALAYPQLAVEVLILLLAFALLIYGISRIVIGGFTKVFPSWLRGLLMLIGLLTIILSVIVLVYPALGDLTLAFILSITFLLNGIESIVSGITGTRPLEH